MCGAEWEGQEKRTIRDLVKVLKWISDSVINHDFSPFRIVTGAPENTFPVVRQYQRVTDKYEEEIYLAFKDEEAGNLYERRTEWSLKKQRSQNGWKMSSEYL